MSMTYAGRVSSLDRLGTNVGRCITAEEGYKIADLDWDPHKEQLKCPFTGDPINGWAIYRSDDLSPSGFIATVNSGYEPQGHKRGFMILDRLLGQIGGAHYENMGSLDGGRIVWGQANISTQTRIRGTDDIYENFAMFATGHAANLHYELKLASIRAICRNTVMAAIAEKALSSFRLKHTASINDHLEAVEARLDELEAGAKGAAMSLEEKMNYLAHRKIPGAESLMTLAARMFPTNADGEFSTQANKAIRELFMLFEHNDGDEGNKAIRGTALNWFNATTEYVDHYRPTRGGDVKRAESSIRGDGNKFKNRVLEMLLAEVKNYPHHDFPTMVTTAPSPNVLSA